MEICLHVINANLMYSMSGKKHFYRLYSELKFRLQLLLFTVQKLFFLGLWDSLLSESQNTEIVIASAALK